MQVTKTVLKGKEWAEYLRSQDFHKIITRWDAQITLYSGVTYNHHNILKIGDYYFALGCRLKRGYKNISSLKKLL